MKLGNQIFVRKCDSLSGRVIIPVSKSIAHRFLFASAVYFYRTNQKITLLYSSCELPLDVQESITALRSVGFTIDVISGESSNFMEINGFTRKIGEVVIPLSESGTTYRFITPIAQALCDSFKIDGSEKLLSRPNDLIDYSNIEIKNIDGGSCLGNLYSGDYTIQSNDTSQYISALLIALALPNGQSSVSYSLEAPLGSKDYIQMTIDVLKTFGIKWASNDNGSSFTLSANQKIGAINDNFKIDSDYYSKINFDLLNTFGHSIEFEYHENISQCTTDVVKLFRQIASLSEGEMHEIDCDQIIDVVPLLAVCAIKSKGITILSNVSRLRFKESDRFETVCDMVRCLGAHCETTFDKIFVQGLGKIEGGLVDPSNDHRIAMAGAIAGILSENGVTILNPKVVAKSYPGFWDDLEKIGVFNG